MNLINIRNRSRIIKLIRAWFDARGFEEMVTPRLVGLPGQEPFLDPFFTEVVDADGKKYHAGLITSPEYAMKKLLAAGCERIYDLGPCFRNGEPWDGTHDPEFLLLEWYRRDAGMAELIADTQAMMLDVATAFGHVPEVMKKPWRTVSVEQAWREVLNIELGPLLDDRSGLASHAIRLGQTVAETDSWDDIYFKIFLSHVEPVIAAGAPTFLTRYPASMAALARRSADDSRWADRVELYVDGLELANGFAELSDPVEQRKRFEEERELRRNVGKNTWAIDEAFIAALPAMGNAAGIAFGVERLVMLLTGATSITDVLPFSARERFGNE